MQAGRGRTTRGEDRGREGKVGERERGLTRRRGRIGTGGRRGGSRRTSSDFSAVAAASERAALLCTSSLMASPVQPWFGSVLYHTAGRVPRFPPPLPPPPPSSHPPLADSPARSARRARLSALTLSVPLRLFISVRLLFLPTQWRKGRRASHRLVAEGHGNFCFLSA